MHRTTKLLAATALLGALALAAEARASEYVPNRETDTWRYKNVRYGTEQGVRIDATSGGWRRYTNFGGLGKLWVWTGAGHEYVYIWNGSTYELLANFAAAVGSRSRITIGCNRGELVLAAKGLTLQTPAGSFRDVARLDLQTSCADAGVGSIWFARGIGVVKWSDPSSPEAPCFRGGRRPENPD